MSTTVGHPSSPGTLRRPSLARAFAVQGRLIHALLLRELQTRFGRSHLGFLWLFIEPLMPASAIGFLHYISAHSSSMSGVSIFVFYLIGYTPYFAFRAIISRAIGAFRSNIALMYHRQVRLFDVVVARHLLEMGAVLTVMVLVVFGVAFVTERLPHSVLALTLSTVLLLLYAHGLGMLAAALAAASDIAERFIHPMIYLSLPLSSLPLSGAFYTMHSLPTSVREILLWNPQVHFHEMMREGMFGDVLISYYDVPYMLGAVAVANLLGMSALRAVRPRLEL